MKPSNTDSNLARGMDIALTLLVFLVAGFFLDRWLGLFPLFTLSFTTFAAVGTFIRLKYTYDAEMERLEAERRDLRAARHGAAPATPDSMRGAA